MSFKFTVPGQLRCTDVGAEQGLGFSSDNLYSTICIYLQACRVALYWENHIGRVLDVQLDVDDTGNCARGAHERAHDDVKVAVLEVVDPTGDNVQRKEHRREAEESDQPVFASPAVGDIEPH